MRSSISAPFRSAAEASQTSDIFLVFATITHQDLDTDVRVVCDVVDYQYGGKIFTGCPFEITLLTDSEAKPTAEISIQNVDRIIGDIVIGLNESPRLKLELICLSQFTAHVDATLNARTELGDTVVDYVAEQLRLSDVTIDSMMVTANVTSWDFSGEPWPVYRATKNRLPGLYR